MTFITRTPVLWALFVLMVVCIFAFQHFTPAVGGQFLDMLDEPLAIREAFDAMTPEQKSVHFWVTVLVDTAFPVSFGLLFAGLAWRFFGEFGVPAAIPAFTVLIVDLTENTVQALALSGTADALDAKVWVTPLKMGLFYIAALIAVVALAIAVFRLVTKKKA